MICRQRLRHEKQEQIQSLCAIKAAWVPEICTLKTFLSPTVARISSRQAKSLSVMSFPSSRFVKVHWMMQKGLSMFEFCSTKGESPPN